MSSEKSFLSPRQFNLLAPPNFNLLNKCVEMLAIKFPAVCPIYEQTENFRWANGDEIISDV